MHRVTTLVLITLALAISSAQAQEGGVEEVGETTEAAAPADSAPASSDQGRFRFGINGAVGLESVSAGNVDISGLMYGLDLRLGYQVNDLLAIYAQPHLSFGSLSADTGSAEITGFTGTLAATLMGEATLSDRFFAGAGLGYAIFNNPSGAALDFRVGGYPLSSRDDDGVGRTGLMVGLDMRVVFLEDPYSGLLIMGTVGYESF